jgi:hypothetical protein
VRIPGSVFFRTSWLPRSIKIVQKTLISKFNVKWTLAVRSKSLVSSLRYVKAAFSPKFRKLLVIAIIEYAPAYIPKVSIGSKRARIMQG